MKGFEEQPRGNMIGQRLFHGESVGLAHERCVGYHKDFHVHDRPMFVFPRLGTRMSITVIAGDSTNAPPRRAQSSGKDLIIDDESVLYLPAQVLHDDQSLTHVYDTLALYPTPLVLQQILLSRQENYSLVSDQWLCTTQLFSRSRLQSACLERLVHSYVIESESSEHIISDVFTTLLDDILWRQHRQKPSSEPTASDGGGTGESLAHEIKRSLDAHLFTDISSGKLAKRFARSAPTINKLFRAAFGVTPLTYVRLRRLQTASTLLKDDRHSVEEVALLVGYSDSAAFSHAFKKQYGVSPAEARNTGKK